MLTAENLRDRKSGIGASEIGAVAGLNPWSSPLSVWEAKCKPRPQSDETPDQKRGNRLEGAILEWLADEIGLTVTPNNELVRHPDHPIVIATPDGYAHQGGVLSPRAGVAEVKAPGWTQSDWTDPEDDPCEVGPNGAKIGRPAAVARYYLPQVQYQLAATGLSFAYVGALVYAPHAMGRLWVYRIDAHPELQEALIEVAEKFWRDHVETKIPPVEQAQASDLEVVKRLFAQTSAELTPVLSELVTPTIDLARRFAEVKAEIKAREDERDRIHAILTGMCGSGAGLDLGIGAPRVTWKTTKGSEDTNWQAVAMDAGATPEIVARHTRIKPGYRVLRVSEPKLLPAKKSKKEE